MTIYHKRTIRNRIAEFYDDCLWKWDRHHEGFWCGFVFGVLCVVIVFELVWSI